MNKPPRLINIKTHFNKYLFVVIIILYHANYQSIIYSLTSCMMIPEKYDQINLLWYGFKTLNTGYKLIDYNKMQLILYQNMVASMGKI